jgi:hypothetical protein
MRSYTASGLELNEAVPGGMHSQKESSAQRLTTQARRGPVGVRQSGRPLAATNVQTAGSVCKGHDAVHLGRKKGLQPRASERPAVACSG